MKTDQVHIDKPSIAYWRDHSAGASRRRATPTPRGSRPSTAAFHEVGREERERDRHIDLSNAAFVACSNLLDTGHGASNNLIKPTPAARDRCDECGAGLGAYGRGGLVCEEAVSYARRPSCRFIPHAPECWARSPR